MNYKRHFYYRKASLRMSINGIIHRVSLTAIVLLFFRCAIAQTPMYFGVPSAEAYKNKIQTLKNEKAPKQYTNKNEQKIFAQHYLDRNEALLSRFNENIIVKDSLLLKKCSTIFQQIKTANPAFQMDSIRLYISRTSAPNASSFGENSILINLGLLFWIDNDEELALVIAHELAHQLLHHFDQRVEKAIKLYTSEDFLKSIQDIKKSTDLRYQQLKKLTLDIAVDESQHSTFKETEADSLAFVFIKNAKIDAEKAAMILYKFEFIDDFYGASKLYDLKKYFPMDNLSKNYFGKKTSYKGLSMANVTMSANEAFRKLKTHPEPLVRYKKNVDNKQNPTINCCALLQPNNTEIKTQALKEYVKFSYEQGTITLGMHICLMALEGGFDTAYFQAMLLANMLKLYHLEKKLNRFNFVHVEADPQSNLKALQDFLFDVKLEDIEKIYTRWMQKPIQNKELAAFIKSLYDLYIKNEDKKIVTDNFTQKSPNSHFIYTLTKTYY